MCKRALKRNPFAGDGVRERHPPRMQEELPRDACNRAELLVRAIKLVSNEGKPPRSGMEPNLVPAGRRCNGNDERDVASWVKRKGRKCG